MKWRTDKSIEKLKSRLSSDLETHKSELAQETERLKGEIGLKADAYKLGLKKQELLFLKEIEAANAFVQLRRSIIPKTDSPDFDWEEAKAAAARNLEEHEHAIQQFEIAHSVVIPYAIRKDIAACRLICSDFKFDGIDDDVPQLFDQAARKAGEMILLLEEIEDGLIRVVRSWDT